MYTKCNSVHIFNSLKDEPDTQYILNHIKKSSRDYYTPTAFPEDNPKTDIVLVPGTKFDRHMNRKGRGGGYYDRFLSGASGIKIGIAYYSQLYSKLTAINDWDVKMDYIITERGLLQKRDANESHPFGYPFWTFY